MPMFHNRIDVWVNLFLQDDPESKLLLGQTKSIEIQNNELVIETE
jgi:hypothetical protein